MGKKGLVWVHNQHVHGKRGVQDEWRDLCAALKIEERAGGS